MTWARQKASRGWANLNKTLIAFIAEMAFSTLSSLMSCWFPAFAALTGPISLANVSRQSVHFNVR